MLLVNVAKVITVLAHVVLLYQLVQLMAVAIPAFRTVFDQTIFRITGSMDEARFILQDNQLGRNMVAESVQSYLLYRTFTPRLL